MIVSLHISCLQSVSIVCISRWNRLPREAGEKLGLRELFYGIVTKTKKTFLQNQVMQRQDVLPVHGHPFQLFLVKKKKIPEKFSLY